MEALEGDKGAEATAALGQKLGVDDELFCFCDGADERNNDLRITCQ